MRSKTSKRIQSETSSETKDKALNYAKEVIMKTTLEEAAEKHSLTVAAGGNYDDSEMAEFAINDFKTGARWQSEQSNQAIQELVQALEVATVYIRNLGGNADEYEHIIQKHKPKQ